MQSSAELKRQAKESLILKAILSIMISSKKQVKRLKYWIRSPQVEN